MARLEILEQKWSPFSQGPNSGGGSGPVDGAGRRSLGRGQAVAEGGRDGGAALGGTDDRLEAGRGEDAGAEGEAGGAGRRGGRPRATVVPAERGELSHQRGFQRGRLM